MALLWAHRSAAARRVFQNVLRLDAEEVRQRSQRTVAPQPAASKQRPLTGVLKSFQNQAAGKEVEGSRGS